MFKRPSVGERKYRLALYSLLLGSLLGFAGIHYGRELVGVAAIIAAVLAGVGAPFAAGNIGEWSARAKLGEQTAPKEDGA